MGLWASLQAQAQPIAEIQISERRRLGLTRLQAQEEGVPALGYVLENRVIGEQLAALLAAPAADMANAANADSPPAHPAGSLHWLAPARVTAVSEQPGAMRVDYQHQQRPASLSARLLIAADGHRSLVREALGISTVEQDYGLSAIVANVQTQLPHRGVAYERFTPSGPLAMLPLPPYRGQSRSALVLTVKHAEVEALLALPEADFLAELQQRFGQRLGRLQALGQRAAYPVALHRAERCTAARCIVLGNAAQSLNPVAGQGFNLALRDVAALLEQLAAAPADDPGAPALLHAYAASRARDRQQTIRFTDALIKLFSNTITPLAHARAGGLLAADLLPPLRQQFARQGMGLQAAHRIRGLPCR